MMKQATKLRSFGGLGVGIGAAWLAIACGSSGGDEEAAETPEGDGRGSQMPADCADDPRLPGCSDAPAAERPMDTPARPADTPADPGVEPTPAACPGQLISFDELYGAIAADLGDL